jgi:uncharacterized protein (DUF1697 family)
MPSYVALLRGINVGKSKRISMADLRALVEHLGGTDVKTYVNSGNIVFGHEETSEEKLETAIADAIKDRIGHEVPVVIRTGAELAKIVAGNPFPDAAADPKTPRRLPGGGKGRLSLLPEQAFRRGVHAERAGRRTWDGHH